MAIIDSSQAGTPTSIDNEAHALLQRTATGLASSLDQAILTIASQYAATNERRSVSSKDVIDAIESTSKVLLYVLEKHEFSRTAAAQLVKIVSVLEQTAASEINTDQLGAQAIGLKSQVFFPTDASAIAERRGTLGENYGRRTRPIRALPKAE